MGVKNFACLIDIAPWVEHNCTSQQRDLNLPEKCEMHVTIFFIALVRVWCVCIRWVRAILSKSPVHSCFEVPIAGRIVSFAVDTGQPASVSRRKSAFNGAARWLVERP
jgi:hypothetical protein